jgi:hypothetical protein
VSASSRPDLLQTLWPLSAIHISSLLQQRQALSPPSLSSSTVGGIVQPVMTAAPSPPCELDVGRAIQSARWSTLISCSWGNESHINCLELEALQLGLRWFASRPSSIGVRLPLLVDSSTVYCIMRKGRSSATSLLSLFRRCSALTLAMSASLVPVWLPSHLNPADAPSRNTFMASASGQHLPGGQGHV